jgi:type I restriction enzyme S subunit
MIQTKETTTFKKYPAYKDSGVEWLGEIPEGWDILKIKRIANTKAGGTPLTTNNSYWNGNIPWIPSGKLQNCVINTAEKYITKKGLEKSATKLIKKNTTLIALTGATCANIGYLKFESTANQSVVAIEEKKNFNGKFVFYSLINIRKIILLNQTGGAQAGINENDVKNIIIPIPELKEQTAIAHFLDDKTAKIDQAIAQKEQLIALLKERKQIIIQDAVTGKLKLENGQWIKRPQNELKDSGIPWIGEIPEHWEVKKFRYIFSLGKGLTITKENLQDEGIACVNYGEIHSKYGFEVNPEIHELKCVDNEYLKSSPNALLKQGDFVFADTSEDIEGSGNFTYLNSNQKTFAGYHTVIARPKCIVNSRFLAYSFDSLSFRNQIRNKVKGVKVYSITQSILSEPVVWLPTIKEQEEIVEFLDNKCIKYDQSINLNVRQIEKLKEYKATLIDSAVTGKIKVSA